jgi:hypothetical protein
MIRDPLKTDVVYKIEQVAGHAKFMTGNTCQQCHADLSKLMTHCIQCSIHY